MIGLSARGGWEGSGVLLKKQLKFVVFFLQKTTAAF